MKAALLLPLRHTPLQFLELVTLRYQLARFEVVRLQVRQETARQLKGSDILKQLQRATGCVTVRIFSLSRKCGQKAKQIMKILSCLTFFSEGTEKDTETVIAGRT